MEGDYVEARCMDWSQFYGGVVKAVNPDFTFDVLFDDNERVPKVRFEEIRRPTVLKKKTTAPAFSPGTRVLCKIAGWNNWFPGEVARVNDDGTYVVNFDDGDVVSTIRPHEMRLELQTQDIPTYIKVGSSVECKCEGWRTYYPGLIKAIDLQLLECTVMFEDGELRTDVSISQIRMARSPSKNAVQFADDMLAPSKFKVGDRVMANPNGEWSRAYPGKVERIQNDSVTYAILFDDGDRAAGVREDDMSLISTTKKLSGPREEKEIEYRVDMSVEAKVGTWRTYYSGTIEKINPDDTFRVLFVDGEAVENVLRSEMRPSRLSSSSMSTSKSAPSRASKQPVSYNLQDRVKCQLPHWQAAYWGTIARVNPNGTYRLVLALFVINLEGSFYKT